MGFIDKTFTVIADILLKFYQQVNKTSFFLLSSGNGAQERSLCWYKIISSSN
jgi:hypothetical protein